MKFSNRTYSKREHEKFLLKHGLMPNQIKSKKSVPIWDYDLSTEENVPLSNTIPCNGTKSVCIKKAQFSNENYIIAPAYNKGAYQVISKSDIKTAGKKV